MKSKIFKINYHIYPFDCLVCVKSTIKEIENYLKRYGFELSNEEKEAIELDDIGRGRTVMLEGGQTVIRLNKLDAGTIAHEIFHAVHFLTERLNITLSRDSDEVFAYLTEYLTNEIIKNLVDK